MRSFFFYLICTVLFLVACWLIKLVIIGISPQFGYGFVSGMTLILVLIYSAEKLGYKQPRY